METFILLLVLLGIAVISSIGGALLVYALQPKTKTTVEVKLVRKTHHDDEVEYDENGPIV